DLPAGVTAILRRCLEKDPRQRRRDIGDVRVELDEAIARPATPDTKPVAVAPRSMLRIALPWAVAGAGVISAGVGFWPRLTGTESWKNPLADAQFVPLTDFPGAEREAVISADGRFVAFESDRTGLFHVWLTQIGTGRFSDLTAQDGDTRISANGN